MKIIGSFLIVLASIIASYFYEKSLKSNIKLATELIDLINFIKSKIEYYSLSIDDILDDYYTENEALISFFDNKFDDSLNFDANIKNDINNFFSNIGKGYKKEQLSLCDYTIKSLDTALDKMKTEFTKKAKVFRSLSLFMGVGCVILLV
ncbi:MAG: stage III sporulation protein AB [Clostridia bacterium]|nr:stage III sporulation protein AB [Clostridia bacterium]